jgi:hypothetical protein
MDDTSPAAKARYYELLRRQAPMDRLRTAALLTSSIRQLAEADILRVHPDASELEVRNRMAIRLYGDEVAGRYFSSSVE